MHTKVCRPGSGKKRKFIFPKEFVLHSLRHTSLTRMGESEADPFTIMKLAGHANVTVSQRYVHPTSETVQLAFGRLEVLNRKALDAATEAASYVFRYSTLVIGSAAINYSF